MSFLCIGLANVQQRTIAKGLSGNTFQLPFYCVASDILSHVSCCCWLGDNQVSDFGGISLNFTISLPWTQLTGEFALSLQLNASVEFLLGNSRLSLVSSSQTDISWLGQSQRFSTQFLHLSNVVNNGNEDGFREVESTRIAQSHLPFLIFT